MFRSIMVSAGVVALSLLPSGAAEAAKEKFVRSKPHVNVGTIAHAGISESAVLSLRTVDVAPERGQDVLCILAGSIIVSVPVDSRDADLPPSEASISEFRPWISHDVRVLEDQLLQLELESPTPLADREGVRQTWLVEVRPDERARPVGESCTVEWLVQVFDPATGQSFAKYRPQFYLRTNDPTVR
jgi:hypothetical protein